MKKLTVKELREYLNGLESWMDDFPVVASDEVCNENWAVGCFEDRENNVFCIDIIGRIER